MHCLIDVCNGGRVLQSEEELARMCYNREVPLFLVPMDPEDVLGRVCNNMMNCISHADEVGTLESNETTSLRLLMVSFIPMMLHDPLQTDRILNQCFRAISRRWGLIKRKRPIREVSLT